MKNKNEKLGAVYLEVEGLDNGRFKELTKGMNIHPVYSKYIENYFDGISFRLVFTDKPEPHAKLITLDELERLLNPQRSFKCIR